MKLSSALSRTAALFVVLIALGVARTVAAADIPWQGENFQRISFEEDIKNVLRAILRQRGLQAVFREGVEGEITFEFDNIPAQAAFNKVMIENDLDFDYEAETGIVTIYPSVQANLQRSLIPLANIQPSEVIAAADRFGLGGRISGDAASRTVFVEGTPDQIVAIRDLVDQIDKAKQVSTVGDAERRAARLAIEKARTRERLLEQLGNRKIQIFPMRYANVAATSTQFHGEQVTIPGIEESLRRLLGAQTVEESGLTDDELKAVRRERPLFGASLQISSDPRTNSVIVRGTQEDIDKAARLIEQLDRPVPMVQLDVMIVRAQRAIADDLAVRWAFEQNFTDQQFLGIDTGVPTTGTVDRSTQTP